MVSGRYRVVRQHDDLADARFEPSSEQEPGDLDVVGMGRGCPVPHVPDVIELSVPSLREQANLKGGAQEINVLDLREVVFRRKMFASIGRRHGDLVEVREVVCGDAPTKLANRLVPEVVQSRVEQPRRGGGDHLADVIGATAFEKWEASERRLKTLECVLTLFQLDQDVLCR